MDDHTGKVIAELVLFILGVFMILCPKVLVRFQVWSQRVLMKAQYIPSQRTYTVVRIIGVLLVIIGLAVAIGVLK